ncbi:MAG: PocR ligand-binding domain-containing protein [Deltaproteobacteria bacterium]|nr:PocR ligand-binding domain-containing protein [Deltaproteobacteria bacterium]
MNKLRFSDLIDVAMVQELMDGYYAVTGIPTGIIDGEGHVWTATGWLDICTKFHRINPVTAEKCRESDTYISTHLHTGQPYVSYKCAHGLTDVSSPIIVGGQHVAQVMTGQFFLEKPDVEFFREQARKFGFDEDAYLKALAEVPLITEEKLDAIMKFLAKLAQFLADMGYKRLKEIEAQEALQQAHASLERKVEERTVELKAAKETAEAANRAKSVFLANMSHELRTPLNAVLGFSQVMKNSRDVTVEQRENLNIITRSGEHLLHLINNVLDMSKIESGRVELEESPLDLHQLVQEIRSLMYVRAHEKELNFTLEQSPDLPRHIAVDGGKLRQVLLNLIGNAMKYTKQGGVTLRAMGTQQETAGRASVRFEVKDTGPGIHREDREHIFAPFVQLGDQPPTEASSGLGLAICRQYVELMGGAIGVAGEPGKGSVFYFEIPVTVLAPETMPAARQRGRVIGMAEGQPRYRLLIAEDHPENRLLLHKMLEPFGFDLREAANGQVAVAIFAEWRPHLIWMDIRMPIMDGLEATRHIKATDAGAQTRIVAITAHALEKERREILAAGCDDFIRKPYKDVEILEALTKNLGVRFVYEEETTPVAVAMELHAAALAELPDELLNTLEQALSRIDINAVGRAIEEIRAHHPSLADALAAVARDLQFGRMLWMVRAALGETGPEDETCIKK